MKSALEALGHRVWLRPHWNDELAFATTKEVDVVVGCQIAEESTAYIARFTQENGVHLVINTSEQLTTPDKFEAFLTFDRHQLNESVISLQALAFKEIKDYVEQHPGIKDKLKYKLVGFPRFDISTDPGLRAVECRYLEKRYDLIPGQRRVLFLSSLMFEETFCDIGPGDMERFQYAKILERNYRLRDFMEPILDELIAKYLGPDGVLLIKRHPWDMSPYYEKRYRHPQVRLLEHGEYVVPCIGVADCVLHSFSTSAVEAWIMGKPTVSLMPSDMRKELTLIHMRDEPNASSFRELTDILASYPTPAMLETARRVLGAEGDGKATIRLAREIHKLKPKRDKKLRRNPLRGYRQELKWWLEDNGYRDRDPRRFNGNLKMERLLRWESMRTSVESHYKDAVANFIEQHRAELLATQ